MNPATTFLSFEEAHTFDAQRMQRCIAHKCRCEGFAPMNADVIPYRWTAKLIEPMKGST